MDPTDFFRYSSRGLNYQDFILAIIKVNKMVGNTEFIKQNVRELIPNFVSKIRFSKITDLKQ